MTEPVYQFNFNNLDNLYKGKNKRGPSSSSLIWIEHKDGMIIEILSSFSRMLDYDYKIEIPESPKYHVFLITKFGLRYEIAIFNLKLDLIKLIKYECIVTNQIEKDWIANSIQNLITLIKIYDVQMT
jgi:hypothetical protein